MSSVMAQERMLTAKHILNHDIMNCTAEGVSGNHLYSGRALGISEPWDMIQLHPDLQPLWEDITAHYQRVGLQHSSNVIWDVGLEHLGMHIGYQPSVFYFGPAECKYWGDSQWMDIVEFINSKNNFMAVAKRLGVDTPLTLCFERVEDITDDDIADVVYPAYAKAAVSVSGVGIYRCEDEASLLDALATFPDGTPVQIQEEVVTDLFLNLQYLVTDQRLERLMASEQILDGFVHQGNRVPASHEPWAAVEPLAEWLMGKGMKGIFAFDVAVTQTDKGLRFLAIECNPRFNGASYPSLLANKLGIPAWTAFNFSTRHRSLADIDLSEIEYDSKTGEGAILVNWGTVLAGKLVILMAGSPEYQEVLRGELDARL